MERLRESIEKNKNLVFVSNSHNTTVNALSIIISTVHHEACTHRVTMNIKAMSKSTLT